ncbi:MAG: nucleoside triphosphate pyrophosphohydrolase [Methylococcales bacterium]|nr:nucleoside triphosphate pyrophosphohydrolase [Methylococcales bacterium]
MSLKNTEKLLRIMSQLRDSEMGCAWDLKQDFISLIPHTIEEAYEVADAAERNDMGDLRSELGDLLLQVVFYSQMATEEGLFNFEQVAETICEKLINRHPHIFAGAVFKNDDERKQAWEMAKERERAAKKTETPSTSVLEGIANTIPALIKCEKIQDRAAHHGFDWQQTEPVFDKVLEELNEIKEAWKSGNQAHIQEEVGDLLLVTVNLARHLKVNPEIALKESNQKFTRRFHYIEQQVKQSGRTLRECKLSELDAYWDQAKIVLKK